MEIYLKTWSFEIQVTLNIVLLLLKNKLKKKYICMYTPLYA